jgi:hypothetical protein
VTGLAARGTLLGCWQAENRPLGRLIVPRDFTNDTGLAQERKRARVSSSPLDAAGHLTDLTMHSFASFPFVPPLRTWQFGPVYELRDYHPRPGGLPSTTADRRQVPPGRHRIDPLTVVMYALDDQDRIVQIWPSRSLDERVVIRRDLYAMARYRVRDRCRARRGGTT